MPDLRIEYPTMGETYEHQEYGVYRYDEYPESSVLAGQERRTFLGSYPTLEDAKREFPEAKWSGKGATGYRKIVIPHEAPSWFDPANAGETWDDKDY